MDELNNKDKINLSKVLMNTLNSGDWKELFAITECDDCPQNSSQFYKDVHWNNDSLKQGCINAVEFILDANPVNIKEIWGLEGVQGTLKRNKPELYNAIESIVDGVVLVANPNVNNTNESVFKALEDAEVLLTTQGASSAYDRMHTALHGFLRQVCHNNNISFVNSDAITALIPKISSYIKEQPDDGRNSKVFAMLRAAGSMLDTINYLRNHHSMSHPNENLLKESDAKFAINLARSIMTYIDDLFD
ncbi:MAG TPA: abortive phage infection protein [Pseudomonas sabulinigri]|uniref:Abortive infection protein-like C-terminal domain-containing protein n=1 Tax=marine sediment metagenome TaxID=412755 RepID=A0A0F9T6K4_9ZZZZ|nr:abortive phage infection protein [Halopseudomonas sabulinigri]HEC53750.1 abortive phage infection protein [Halopseudomonas sabulinigri]